MDINLSYTIPNEDLIGVLRTILMFLESINFNTTCATLQKECFLKGFLTVLSAQAKTVVVAPTVELQPTTSKCTQDCTDSSQFYNSPEPNGNTKKPTQIFQSKSPDFTYERGSHNTEIETSSSKETRRIEKNRLRKSLSNPTLKLTPKVNRQTISSHSGDVTEDKQLKKKFQQLQNEHQKLMGVATELTVALQTHLLGQSENLNLILNNCKNIYPDLFSSNVQCIEHCPENDNIALEETSMKTSENDLLKPPTPFNEFKDKVILSENDQELDQVINSSEVDQSRSAKHNENSLGETSNIYILDKEKHVPNQYRETSKQLSNLDSTHDELTTNEIGNVVSKVVNSVLFPTMKRPHSSSVILVTASNDQDNKNGNKPKILVRQISSVSCDDSLISIMSKAEKSSKEILLKDSEFTKEFEITEKVETSETVHFNNNHCKPPEIFISTENLDKTNNYCSKSNSSRSNFIFRESPYFYLDFKNLKKDILNGDDNLKLRLLQALRWRITHSDGEVRDQIVSSYIRHDLLGLHSSPNISGQSVLEMYFCPNKETPHMLQEAMARLANTLASVTLGRDYLSQDEDFLVSLLVPLFIGIHYSKTKLDDITRDMLVAIIQKLSLRRKQRIKMIAAGLVEYLVSFLSTKQNEISEYCTEYATALFMNLCLHSEARERLRSCATDVVSLLADLMSTKYKCCIPYVNGAMYSLLGDTFINQEAKRLNLSKLIDYHIKRSDGEIQKQLEFILRVHLNGTEEGECMCDPSIDPQNEVDLLEPELDDQDTVKSQPAGEELLQNYKLMFPVYGSQVYSVHLKCLCRPVTPTPRINSNHNEVPQTCTNTENYAEINNSQNFDANTASRYNKFKKYDGVNENERIIRESVSHQSSRTQSPDMAYSEDTKQFYHIPSARTGIFENSKTKRTHKVPPSFTRTIPLPIRNNVSCTSCSNPHCSIPYSKTIPFIPKNNSSVRNPPYALHYPMNYGICYRENSTTGAASYSYLNCKPNKYRCNCYNAIKGFIDQDTTNDINTASSRKSTTKMKVCRCNTPANQQNCSNCQESKLSSQSPHGYNSSAAVNQPVDINTNIVNFSYEELVANADSGAPSHNQLCSNLPCRCYDEVFQSRPKILRTPP